MNILCIQNYKMYSKIVFKRILETLLGTAAQNAALTWTFIVEKTD